MDAFRTLRARGAARALARALAKTLPLGVAFACSSATKMPPEIGDCIPDGGVPCGNPGPGAVGMIITPDASHPSTMDASVVTAVSEGGSCGMADTMIASPCAPCIVTSCCMADSLCSSDPGCLDLVTCAVNGAACQSLTAGSAIAFDDLRSCFDLNCPQQCQAIAARDL